MKRFARLRELLEMDIVENYYAVPTHIELANSIPKLLDALEIAIETLKYVETCDAHPDLSAFKYRDAYNLIRHRVRDTLVKITNE